MAHPRPMKMFNSKAICQIALHFQERNMMKKQSIIALLAVLVVAVSFGRDFAGSCRPIQTIVEDE